MESTPGTLQELAQAEERMRSVVNHVVDGIITIDEHGTADVSKNLTGKQSSMTILELRPTTLQLKNEGEGEITTYHRID